MRIIIILSILFLPNFAKANGFFEERYRGWLWFEEEKINQETDKKILHKNTGDISPEEAQLEIENLKEELDKRRYVMMTRPTPENVKHYREKEKEMWDLALKLHESWDMANLKYPEQQDLINNPLNVYAVKMKREKDREIKARQIKEFAKKFDLVLFFKSDCGYCQAFSPVLKNFGDKYGFTIEAINMEGGLKHETFKTKTSPQLIASLGIEAVPSVVAVSHDSKTAFELIRGFVTLSELEDYSILALKYLKGEHKW